MRGDPFNLREQLDSIDDANETRAMPDTTTPEERQYWADHYQRIYRQENEARKRFDAEHPEIAAKLKERCKAEGLELDERAQSLLDDLFGGE